MKRNRFPIAAAGATVVLAACSSTPERIPELDAVQSLVPQLEASPRAGVAATNIAEARKALDRANELAAKGKDVEDIQFEANLAAAHAPSPTPAATRFTDPWRTSAVSPLMQKVSTRKSSRSIAVNAISRSR